MNGLRVLVYVDGPHEGGHVQDTLLSRDELPALPGLIDRILRQPRQVGYVCTNLKAVVQIHGKGPTFGLGAHASSRYSKAAMAAVVKAKNQGFAAAVILIDRDRKKDAQTIESLRAGRDRMEGKGYPGCAVGMAVEAFDAWMIVDGNAIAVAGGNPGISHPNPESLDGEEGSGRHPKERAAQIFGSGIALGQKYATVASNVDLDLLARCCPKGFAPFAEDIKRRILPVLTS